MTEDEAKTKWCAFAKPEDIRGKVHGCNRYDGGKDTPQFPFSSRCIASECMMWRKLPAYVSVEKAISGDECPIESGGGYCGMAGKP